MDRAAFCTRPSRNADDDDRVDVVAIALGVILFALLIALVEGIERI